MTRTLVVRGGRFSKMRSLMTETAQVNVSIRLPKAAEAQFRQARAALLYNRVILSTVTPGYRGPDACVCEPSTANSIFSNGHPEQGKDFTLPVDLSYQVDAWVGFEKNVDPIENSTSQGRQILRTVSLSMHAGPGWCLPFQASSLDDPDQNSALDITGVRASTGK